MKNQKEMQRGLKNRHLQMIALGGAIGTGLFYGSASTIKLAGPSVMLAYLTGGVVIFLIMRMLGEMAVEEPVSGSFSHYAAKYWGAFPGFLSGWNYWFNYVIVSMAELSVIGIYMNYWLPDLPQWLSALVVLAFITALNLVAVKAYGEMEFWLAIVKVAAIVLMIALGLYLIFSRPGPFPVNFSSLWAHGGFFPNGVWGMMLSISVVMSPSAASSSSASRRGKPPTLAVRFPAPSIRSSGASSSSTSAPWRCSWRSGRGMRSAWRPAPSCRSSRTSASLPPRIS